MLGLVQKILFKLIDDVADEKTIQEVKKRAGVPIDKEFRIDTAYADEEWQRLFAATLEVLKLTPEQAYEAYADAFCKDVLQRFPTWFELSKNSYEFLKRQPAIHNSLAKGIVDRQSRQEIQDKFHVEAFNNKLVTHYKSANKLCGLYKTNAKWIINHYNDQASIEETSCMHNGDDECEIHIEWQSLSNN